MTLDKNTTLRFIYKAKQYKLNCSFASMIYNKIPVYYSSDVEGINIIQLDTEEVFIIGNEDYIKDISQSDFEIEVWYNLLRIYYKENKDNIVLDICIAYWFGFNNAIENIKRDIHINEESKNYKIDKLEKIMITDTDIKVPSRENILNDIRFIGVK
jgi:hypothetical protein